MSTSSKLSKGVSLSSQSRQIVNNVYEFCCEERDLQKVSQSSTADPQAQFLIPPTQIHRRVSHLTGVSERSVTRIVSQRSEGPPMSPVKRSTWQGKVSAVDDFDIAAVKRTIHHMYEQGQRVTLDTLLCRVQEDIGLNLSRSSLRKLVQQNGYRFRCVDKRRILMEKPAVVAARATFLRTMRKIRAAHPTKLHHLPRRDMV